MGDVASLDVVLGAKVSGLESGLNKAQKELAQTSVAAQKLDSALQKGVKGTNSASVALVNLGRVAQDAPFGFIGIQNNLNPLLESFQRLKAETGSTGGALKALGSSLIGPAGLGLALSLVSSLLVVFGDKLFSSSKAANAAKDAFDGLLESTAKEALKLKENFAQITDANIPLENRKKIIEGLRSEYGVYLKNISDEALLTGQAAAAYDLINAAIFKKLQLQALEDKILPFIKEQVNLQFQLNEEIKKGNDLRAFIDATTGAKQSKVQKDNAVAIAASNENLGKQLAIQRQIARVGEDINRMFKSIVPLLQFDDNAIGGIKAPKAKIEKALRESFGTGQIAVFPVKVPMQVDVELDKTHGSLSPAGNSVDRQALIQELEKAYKAIHIKVPIDVQGFSNNTLKDLTLQATQILEKFQSDISGIITTGIADIFSALGESIGNGQGLFTSLGNVLGGLFKALGRTLIQFGIEAAILQKVLRAPTNPLSPILSIAAGIALTALGAKVQSSLPHLATGGIVPPGFPNDTFPALLKSNEAVIPLDRLGDFVPQGGVQVMIPSLRWGGNELVLAFKAATQQYGRKYKG